MRVNKSLLFSVMLLAVSVTTVAVAVPCACAPVIPVTPQQTGGFAFASFGNGAAFTWDTYVAPIIKITTNGTSTTANTTPGYFKNSPSNNQAKYTFNNNLGLGSGRQSDLNELVKVLIAENLLAAGTSKTVYDNQTRDAVANLQKKYGIKPAPQYPYGYFGPLTRAFLNSR